MRTAFENEGDVRSMDLLAGLVGLWRESANATLQFSRSGATAGFDLAAGEIASTSSSDPRFETATILVRAGKLDANTLERLSFPEGADRALVALQAGLLTRREWRWGEKIRAVEVLSDLLGWIDGEYWLFRTSERAAAEFRLPVPRLILELFLRSRDRSLVLHYLGGADVPLGRTESFDSEFATFGLTADAESVVRLIDGRSTAAEIASEAPSDAFAVEKLLAALVTLGLVQAEFSRARAAPGEPIARGRPARRTEDETDEESDEVGTPAEAQDDVEESVEEGSEETAAAAGEGHTEIELAGHEPEIELPSNERQETWPESDGTGETAEEESPTGDVPLHGADAEQTALDASGFSAESSPYGTPGDLGGSESEREPAFQTPLDISTGIGALERPGRRSGSPLVWTLALLVGGVAALLWFRSRTPAPPSGAIAAPSPSPAEKVETPDRALGTTPGLSPERAVALPAATATAIRTSPTAALPAPRPTRRTAPAVAPTAAPAPESTRETSRQYWAERAARDQKRVHADRGARYTIQLELACEVSSLVDAWKHDRPGGTMWVLATSFQGRPCFRVLWGRYPTREAARKALSGIPTFFVTPRNRPIVTGIR